MGPVLVIMCTGLVVEAWAVGRSRGGDLAAFTQVLFWAGLLLIFLPATARIISRSTGRAERIGLTLALAVILQLSRTVLYPMFAYHDEFIHENTVRQIVDSHHLFASNPLLPVAADYPGLALVTDAMSSLTGLSVHTSAVLVLLLARVVSTLAILGLVDSITGSSRAAGVAAVVYTCNPQAIFFNAQFSYQSLALPLGLFALYAFISRDRRASTPGQLAVPLIVTLAVVVTHHLTSMLLVAALAAWLLIDLGVIRRRHRTGNDWRGLLVLVVGGGAAIVGWALLPGNPVLGYLDAIGTSSVTDIEQRLSGKSTRVLFKNGGGLVSPLWERGALIASILIVFVAVIPAVVMIRRWSRGREAVLVLLGLVALAYPIIPLGHVTPGTGEVTDRASGFLFLGVGLAVALGPALRSRRSERVTVPLLTALFGIVFVGGVVLGAGPTVGQLPGPFRVSADSRSIDAANLAAASWERANLPTGSRVYADRDSGLLAAAVGGMTTITHVDTGIDASRILLAPTFTPDDRRVIRETGIQYVIVDQRDSTALPDQRVYIESGEYGGENRTRPVSRAALRKLAGVPGVQRVYSNGPIVIYDVRALLGDGSGS